MVEQSDGKFNPQQDKARKDENFASFLGLNDTEKQHRYQRKWLPFDAINVLPQGRKTFEDIDVLAEDIADKGLINLPLVASFNKANTERYLSVINELWHSDFDIAGLRPHEEDGEEVYNVLIAGERRFRACSLLVEKGEYEEAFERDDLEVSYKANMSPMEAIFRQASENTYMSVPPNEEAVYYNEMYRVIRMADPDYPLARFARNVGRSSEKIRSALAFCMLPQEIQDDVDKKRISYGVACEIARLAQAEAGVDDINFYAQKAMVGRYKVDDFRQVINSYFEARSGTMFDIFQDQQIEESRKTEMRNVVKREFVMGLWSFIYYFKHVKQLFEEGKLGQDDSPFSFGSPRRIYTALIMSQRALIPHFKEVMSGPEFERVSNALNEVEESFARYTEDIPEIQDDRVYLSAGIANTLGEAIEISKE